MTSSPRQSCKCCRVRWAGGGHHLLCRPLTSLCSHARAPRELREKIQPEILELIKQQRLNRLCEGSSFRKIGNRRRQGEGAPGRWAGPYPPHWGGSLLDRPCREQAGNTSSFCPPCAQAFPRTVLGHLLVLLCVPERFWYCRLALNHKVLHYGDLDDNPQGEVTFESLQEKSRFISPLMCHSSWTRCQET